jgi:hypothetical protein
MALTTGYARSKGQICGCTSKSRKPPAAFGELRANTSDRLVLTGQSPKPPTTAYEIKLSLFMATMHIWDNDQCE